MPNGIVRLFAFFLLPVSSILNANLAFGRTVVDLSGTSISIPKKPLRVITLAPSLGELAADLLGAELNRIIAVSEYSDYPPVLKKLPSIGPYHQISLEKVVALKPDLVLATTDGNSKDQISHLKELAVPVLVTSTQNFDEIVKTIELVGDALENTSEGLKMAEQFKRGLQHFRDRSKGRQKKKVLIQVGSDPLVVAGGKTFLHSALELLGATNIYGDATTHYPRPSVEDVIQHNPDVIIFLEMGSDARGTEKVVQQWQSFQLLNAVKSKQIWAIRGDVLLRPTLRFLEGLAQLEKKIYGKN